MTAAAAEAAEAAAAEAEAELAGSIGSGGHETRLIDRQRQPIPLKSPISLSGMY